ncbi:peptidoglycan endopeptidase [Pelagerythrobacter sp.]|uniref:peptidoglycan endopeptidase n=1 Tax=Pelagerythrobacter sp. TaxID=2800702 RepID=UPI0035B2D1F3
MARAAEALVGTRFRLHGRDPGWGLDCIGLAAAALEGAGIETHPPTGYALRNADTRDAVALAQRSGLVAAQGAELPGDIVLVRAGPAQVHLLVISSTSGFIHAHAGLRRVVACPGAPAWPVLHRWRAIGKV